MNRGDARNVGRRQLTGEARQGLVGASVGTVVRTGVDALIVGSSVEEADDTDAGSRFGSGVETVAAGPAGGTAGWPRAAPRPTM